MLFNTLQFAIFFFIVYSLYISLNHKWQNRLLLVASYVFYGAWDWRFLSLIFISTVVDYISGIGIYRSDKPKKRKFYLSLSIIVNLSLLGFFKYFNFFAENLESFLSHFGLTIQPQFLQIILPVGISFYTFQTMSYTIDIYRKEMKPTTHFFDFALFVAFFPQLVAGPIERAKRLLPQILAKRELNLDKFYEGLYLIFWGLFQKVFIADNLARIVDPIFAQSPPYNPAKVLVGVYAFAFQIFCDFAGYSNIARGLGKLMGFDIMVNFRLPYFSTNPRDFWRRWHISLSTWLRDYLYISLGGSRKGKLKTYRNLAITMLLGGIWHGAAWTFVLWGAYHGSLLIIYRLVEPIREKKLAKRSLSTNKVWRLVKIIIFFHLTCLGWLIFRAQSLNQIYQMLKSFFLDFHFHHFLTEEAMYLNLLFYSGLLILVQIFQYLKNDLMAVLRSKIIPRALFYFVCFYLLIIYGATGGKEFIYFQF